jgi:hypothetical protein
MAKNKIKIGPRAKLGNAFPVIDILLRQRDIESIGVARGLNIGAGSAFTQHLLDRIAGNKMNQQENDRHNKPKDGNHVKQAGCDVAEHGVESIVAKGKRNNLVIAIVAGAL